MAFTNCLPLDLYEGMIEGITIKWTPKAKARLPENARKFEKDLGKIRAATEHVAYASARLQKHTGGGVYKPAADDAHRKRQTSTMRNALEEALRSCPCTMSRRSDSRQRNVHRVTGFCAKQKQCPGKSGGRWMAYPGKRQIWVPLQYRLPSSGHALGGGRIPLSDSCLRHK